MKTRYPHGYLLSRGKQRPTPPRGWLRGRHMAREDDILQGINSGSGPPWEGARPLHIQTGPPGKVQDLPGREPDPWNGSRTPLCGVRATRSRVPGFWDKEYPGLNQGQAGVRSQHVSGPYRVRHCSPLRRRPNAATWPTAHDVSQRAEPDVRPLGYADSAFIADKARRLSIPLAGDVPPRHLMCPVHSAGRHRPGHPAGGVPVYSVGRQYARAVAYTMLIITRALPRKQPRHINTIWTTDIMAPEDCLAVAGMRYFYSVFPPFCPWAHMSGLSTLVRAPLSYKREGTRRYKASSLRHSDSQVHTSSQAQYNTQWSRVLRSGGPNHSKPLSVLVFIFHLASRQNA
jgi:hypothetical protein